MDAAKSFLFNLIMGAGAILGTHEERSQHSHHPENGDPLTAIGGDFRQVGIYLQHGIETAEKETKRTEAQPPEQLEFTDLNA